MVVTSPFLLSTISLPVFISRKQPVPYVFFICPGSKQHCPNSAHCWSPAAPAMGISPPYSSNSLLPYMQLEGFTSGSMHSGTSSSPSSSLSQHSSRML